MHFPESALQALHAPYLFSLPVQWDPNVQKQFPMCSTGVWGKKKMTQQGHLIPDSQHNISQVHNTMIREGLFHYSFPRSTSDKTAAAGPGEKRPRWKITVEINKAIFRRVSGWRSGYLLWGGEDGLVAYVGWHIALLA